ncbi:MAG TPA: hypothetical protein VN646_16880 [Candidatus Acidoferrum sp.]|nr:hypothetical protein [Candidatus Acidoferrum sp.]
MTKTTVVVLGVGALAAVGAAAYFLSRRPSSSSRGVSASGAAAPAQPPPPVNSSPETSLGGRIVSALDDASHISDALEHIYQGWSKSY